MGEIADSAAVVWRDYAVDGDPVSGAHKPVKDEIRGLFEAVEDTIETNASIFTIKPARYAIKSVCAAAGDGVSDDLAALVVARNTGLPLAGQGLTYAIGKTATGAYGFEMISGFSLAETRFKQIWPDGYLHNAAEIRNIVAYNADNIRLNSIFIDRNGDGLGGELSGGGSAGLYLYNSRGCVFKDIDVTGSDRGFGIKLPGPTTDGVFENMCAHDIFWEEQTVSVTISAGTGLGAVVSWPSHPLRVTHSFTFSVSGGGITAGTLYCALPLTDAVGAAMDFNSFRFAPSTVYGTPDGDPIFVSAGYTSPQNATNATLDDAASGIAFDALIRSRLVNCTARNILGKPSRNRDFTPYGEYYGNLLNVDGTQGTAIVSAVNTITPGGTNTVTLASDANGTTTDYYQHFVMCVVGGTGKGLANTITGYDPATKTATFGLPWDTLLNSTSRVIIRSNRWTRGFQCGGGRDSIVTGCMARYADQGFDITAGTGGGHLGFSFHGNTTTDTGTNGFKMVHVQRTVLVSECQAIRAGLWGFVLGGEAVGDLEIHSCVARDTGYGSDWTNSRGFEIVSYPSDGVVNGIHLHNCVATSTIGDMSWGFYTVSTLDPVRPVTLTDCVSIGHTIAPIQGAFVLNPSLTRGTAASPAWTIDNDLNTGLYSPAADALAPTAGGVKLMEWTPSETKIGTDTNIGINRYSSFSTTGVLTTKNYNGGSPIFQRWENNEIGVGGGGELNFWGAKAGNTLQRMTRIQFEARNTVENTVPGASRVHFETLWNNSGGSGAAHHYIGPLSISSYRFMTFGGASAVVTTAGNVTYTLAQWMTGFLCRLPSGAGIVDTLPTAVSLIGAGGVGYFSAPTVGEELTVIVSNWSATNPLTIQPGAGGIVATGMPAAGQVINASASKSIRLRWQNVSAGTEQYMMFM